MCERYSLFIPLNKLIERFGLDIIDGKEYTPRAEIYPTENAPVIVKKKHKQLKLFKWGFPPSYTKRPIINARAETIDEKPTFRESFQKKRCLVPATSFFEWKKDKKGKIKHRIYINEEKIFSMAGIYDNFVDKEGNQVICFSIITTEANKKVEPIHNRMPVILPKGKEDIWLDNNSISELKNLLIPYDSNSIIIERDSGADQLSLF